MDVIGSRTIRVVKRDRRTEDFDPYKLAGAMWRAMCGCGGAYATACTLAGAIEDYLARRSRITKVTAGAVFEMSTKTLRSVGMPQAAVAMEEYRCRRRRLRTCTRLQDSRGRAIRWDKGFLKAFLQNSWGLAPGAANAIASQVEMEVLTLPRDLRLHPAVIIELLNERMAEYGLADAVPLGQINEH